MVARYSHRDLCGRTHYRTAQKRPHLSARPMTVSSCMHRAKTFSHLLEEFAVLSGDLRGLVPSQLAEARGRVQDVERRDRLCGRKVSRSEVWNLGGCLTRVGKSIANESNDLPQAISTSTKFSVRWHGRKGGNLETADEHMRKPAHESFSREAENSQPTYV